jgi:hypothetical protein
MSGDYGKSPFRGQLSGKQLPASNHASVVPQPKHKGARKTYFAVEVVLMNAKSSIKMHRASLDDY